LIGDFPLTRYCQPHSLEDALWLADFRF